MRAMPKVLYIGDVEPKRSVSFESQLFWCLREINRNINLLNTLYIHSITKVISKVRKSTIIILNFDYTKFGLFPLSPLILLAILILSYKRKKLVIFHGLLIANRNDISRSYYICKFNFPVLIYVLLISKIFKFIATCLKTLTIVFTPHDKNCLKNSLLLPHGVPLVSCSGPRDTPITNKSIIVFGSITPRKPLHVFMKQIVHLMKASYDLFILSKLNRRSKIYLSNILNEIPSHLRSKVHIIPMGTCDIELRCKFFTKGIVLIPHCIDITPAYTFYDALAFTRNVIIPYDPLCDSSYRLFLYEFRRKYDNKFTIYHLAKIIYDLQFKF